MILAFGKICVLLFLEIEFFLLDQFWCVVANQTLVTGLNRLTNQQSGQCYGSVKSWVPSKKRRLGAFLLLKAFRILLSEGERQIKPADVNSYF